MRYALPLVFTSFAVACSGGSADRDAAPAPPVRADGGTTAHDDATTPHDDAAAPPDDATAPPDDAGAAPDDAGTTGDAGTATTAPTFAQDVFPMFESFGCTSVACHGSLRAQGGAVVYLPDRRSAYADLFERRSIREPRLLVEPGSPDTSVLFTHGRDANIPAGDLDGPGLALIGAWITAGAPFGEDVVVTPRPPPTTCSLADQPGTPPLPAACLPRCTAETWAGVAACRNQVDVAGCQSRVIAADTSTPTQVDFGAEIGTLPLDCGTCLDLQTETCFVEHCFADYLAATRCRLLDDRPTACGTEVNRAIACAQGSQAFRTCQGTRDQMCVAP